jgi:hypothetical protein
VCPVVGQNSGEHEEPAQLGHPESLPRTKAGNFRLRKGPFGRSSSLYRSQPVFPTTSIEMDSGILAILHVNDLTKPAH